MPSEKNFSICRECEMVAASQRPAGGALSTLTWYGVSGVSTTIRCRLAHCYFNQCEGGMSCANVHVLRCNLLRWGCNSAEAVLKKNYILLTRVDTVML